MSFDRADVEGGKDRARGKFANAIAAVRRSFRKDDRQAFGDDCAAGVGR